VDRRGEEMLLEMRFGFALGQIWQGRFLLSQRLSPPSFFHLNARLIVLSFLFSSLRHTLLLRAPVPGSYRILCLISTQVAGQLFGNLFDRFYDLSVKKSSCKFSHGHLEWFLRSGKTGSIFSISKDTPFVHFESFTIAQN
jgi:hypothetical protein